MMCKLSMFVLLFSFYTMVYADPKKSPDSIDKQLSKLTVKNIHKRVEILRDPTVMSPNFRDALRHLSNNGVSSNEDAEDTSSASTVQQLGLPDIQLVGKMLSQTGINTVVFKMNEQYFHFEVGDQISKVIDNQVVTLHVQEISQHSVRLLVMPFNKTLIFN